MTSPFRELTQVDIDIINKRNRARTVKCSDMGAEPHKIRDSLPKSQLRAGQRKKQRELALSEHAEQSLVIQWWDLYAPSKGLDPRLLFCIPNAAKRSYSLAAWLKAEGMRAGVPDLFLALPMRETFHGMFIEMKSRTGKVTPDQAEFIPMLRGKDYNVIVAHGCESAIQAITVYVEKALGMK